jgi:hypothetical protein
MNRAAAVAAFASSIRRETTPPIRSRALDHMSELPSMSVNRKDTVPDGGPPTTPPSCHQDKRIATQRDRAAIVMAVQA